SRGMPRPRGPASSAARRRFPIPAGTGHARGVPVAQSDQFTAYHEAGHVVACIRFGLMHNGATIKPGTNREGAYLGVVSHEVNHEFPADFDDDREIGRQTRRALIIALAGYAAELTAGQDKQTARGGASSDFEQAEVILGGPVTLDWIEKARAFVRRPRNWKAIEMMAAELLDRESLDAEEACAVVLIADGDAPATYLEEYREAKRTFGREE
ncbi:MAG: hypothetical protein L6Q38_18355, partial [Nitrospira sp.]|nr:hypothetical protein [Nitrospira sp.]